MRGRGLRGSGDRVGSSGGCIGGGNSDKVESSGGCIGGGTSDKVGSSGELECGDEGIVCNNEVTSISAKVDARDRKSVV